MYICQNSKGQYQLITQITRQSRPNLFSEMISFTDGQINMHQDLSGARSGNVLSCFVLFCFYFDAFPAYRWLLCVGLVIKKGMKVEKFDH